MLRRRPRTLPLRVMHITTVDMSLELLLGPQLEAFVAAGFDVVGCSAPGPYVEALERRFPGDREAVRTNSATAALHLVRLLLAAVAPRA